jgi:hypothetical protein
MGRPRKYTGDLSILRDMKVGAVVEYEGARLRCICDNGDDGCADCYFSTHIVRMEGYPEQCAGLKYCLSAKRSDRQSVQFVTIRNKTKEE